MDNPNETPNERAARLSQEQADFDAAFPLNPATDRETVEERSKRRAAWVIAREERNADSRNTNRVDPNIPVGAPVVLDPNRSQGAPRYAKSDPRYSAQDAQNQPGRGLEVGQRDPRDTPNRAKNDPNPMRGPGGETIGETRST